MKVKQAHALHNRILEAVKELNLCFQEAAVNGLKIKADLVTFDTSNVDQESERTHLEAKLVVSFDKIDFE